LNFTTKSRSENTMGLADFFSSFTSTIYADAPEEKSEDVKTDNEEQPAEGKEEEEKEDAPEEEEEEEEPEDVMPALQEECKESAKCAPVAHHFAHCEEKVNAGKGFAHEDCIEEFYHMMHCVDGCVAPKLFAKLK